jgi:undecaprenyl-diphosphatase
MTDLPQASLDLIRWLQQFSPALDPLFHGFTFLGDELFFLVFLPLIYWSIDRRVGARLVVLFLCSTYLSDLLKLWADQPRPFEVDPQVRALVDIDTGGFPSAHTQNTLVVWGYLAFIFRRRWLWWLTALFLILVPLSRLYLGVQFPIMVGSLAVGRPNEPGGS